MLRPGFPRLSHSEVAHAIPSIALISQVYRGGSTISEAKLTDQQRPAQAPLKRRQGRLGDTWFLDEVFVTINGERQYLWRAVDQDGDLIDILVQPRRDARAARRFFRRLLNSQRQEPVRLVTDKLGSYRVAHRDLMSLVTHDTTRYANNRAEVSHQPTRQRERQMRGFTSSNHAQRFLHVHGIIQNLFRVGRHRDAVPDSVLPIRALQLLEYFAQLLDLLAVQGPVALAQSLEGS